MPRYIRTRRRERAHTFWNNLRASVEFAGMPKPLRAIVPNDTIPLKSPISDATLYHLAAGKKGCVSAENTEIVGSKSGRVNERYVTNEGKRNAFLAPSVKLRRTPREP